MPFVLPTVTEALGSGSSELILEGTGRSAPSGIDALIGFNNLVMNNRSWLEGIMITAIDGFSDPDIRTEEANNPQEDGATPFDSFYGGRTIVLKGYLRSFTLDKLRDLEQGMKTAFMPLFENALQIKGKTLGTSVLIYCKKNAPMTWTEEQTRDDMFRRDFMITLRASNPRFVSIEQELQSLFFGFIDQFESNTIANYKFLEAAGTMKVESGVLKPTSTAQKVFTVQDPVIFEQSPGFQFNYTPITTLTGSNVGGYIKYIDSNNHLRVQVDATGAVTITKTIAGSPTGMTFTYTKGSSPVSRSLETTYRLRVQMIGNVIWFYHGTTTEWVTIAKCELAFGTEQNTFGIGVFARPYIRTLPPNTSWTYDNVIFGAGSMTEEEIVEVVNNGNKDAQPKYELTGPIKNPKLTIAETGESLLFKDGTEIKAGEVWTADIKEGTLVDDEGNSKFGRLSPLSDWPELVEGKNHLRLSGEEMLPVLNLTEVQKPGLAIRYRHSWY